MSQHLKGVTKQSVMWLVAKGSTVVGCKDTLFSQICIPKKTGLVMKSEVDLLEIKLKWLGSSVKTRGINPRSQDQPHTDSYPSCPLLPSERQVSASSYHYWTEWTMFEDKNVVFYIMCMWHFAWLHFSWSAEEKLNTDFIQFVSYLSNLFWLKHMYLAKNIGFVSGNCRN